MITRDLKTYGILLPHFGPHAGGDLLLRSTKRIEELGFDAVWVRDHLVFHPHAYEDPDLTHIEPMVVLSALAGITRKIVLGTATLIPYRHPIHTALLLGSLELMAGKGRVIAGWGLGANDSEFKAIGLGGFDRRKLLEENIAVIRKLWSGQETDFEGEFYKFQHVAIKPVAASKSSIPIWYGGGSKAAARRAVEYCDGWMHGRMPRRDTLERIQRMEKLSEAARRPRPLACVLPYVSPGRTVEEGMKYFNMKELLTTTARPEYLLPPSGKFETLDDLDGAAIAGPADVIIEQVRAFQNIGVEHFVFDFRTQFERFEDCVEMVGTEVLPLLHRGDGRKPGSA